jgi:hypothetical protein
MNLTPIKVDDIVNADVRGDRFYALVIERVRQNETLDRRVLRVKSLTGRPIPTQFLTARQVVGHWRRSAQSKC